MTTRHYVVLVKDNIDLAQFWNEMETGVSASPYMPKRPVTIINSRDLFPRLCEYELTDAEADALRNDPRVAEVDIPVDKNPDVVIGPMAVQTGNFSRVVTSPWDNYINWGLTRHVNIDATNNSTAQYQYTLDGTGVDVLISDSGIQVDHPEFTDANGTSRVRQIEWGTIYSPLQYKGGYIDNDGHGTNVAGIATGKTYGWAKNSDIYSLFAPGTWATANPSSVLDHFEGILRWHKAKTSGRPTVVNMSWGFFRQSGLNDVKSFLGSSKITNIVYRGIPVNFLGSGYNLSDSSLNERIKIEAGIRIDRGLSFENQAADDGIRTLVDNGIIVCHCAGNYGTKNDVMGGADYNNYFQIDNTSNKYYYHRGCSPKSPNSISVGAVDTDFFANGVEQKIGFSNAGPGVDVFAAGVNIVSAGSSRVTSNPLYPKNTSYKTSKHSGTSQASPQIAGMCALFLQTNPMATPAEVKAWIVSSANTAVINRGGTVDYTNDRSLFGSAAGVAYLKTSANITNVSKAFVKEQSGNWREVASVFVKQNNTDWVPVKVGYIKTSNGWKTTYKQGG